MVLEWIDEHLACVFHDSYKYSLSLECTPELASVEVRAIINDKPIAELCIRGNNTEYELIYCAKLSEDTDTMFEECADFQEAVNAFLNLDTNPHSSKRIRRR